MAHGSPIFFQSETAPALAGQVHRLFEAQAARTPDAPAVALGPDAMTYDVLDRAANRLARHLRADGVGTDELVGICLARSMEAVVAILAVLKAGGAYLPLDPAYPAERLAYMLENSGARRLVTHASLARDWSDGLNILRLGDGGNVDLTPHADTTLDDPAPGPEADPLAYVIYTSGSTGRPKGVAMPHGPLVNLLRWQARTCPLSPGGRVLQFAPLSFDVSFQEIFSTLGEGGCLTLVTEEQRRDPRGMLRLLDDERITRVFLPPVMLYQLAEQHAVGQPAPGALREVIVAGEALRIGPAVTEFFGALGAGAGCALHNHYGPTETHVVTSYTLQGQPESWPALPSIGQPIDGVRVCLLDESNTPVEPGQPGALHLGGDCLARGYLHDPAQTAAKFVEIGGERWYRTGDLAAMGADGNLQFLGRADDQVKIRGFRVELGEVEAVLARYPAVRETAVGVWTDDSGSGQELVGYIVPRDPAAPPDLSEMRRWLLGQLPEYLVPTHFAVTDGLPLTPSGKVDRRALPRHLATRTRDTRPPADPPRTALEKTVSQAWEAVLNLSPSVRDNFFEVGGNSLLAVRMHTKLCQALGCEFPVTAVFQHPTVAGLAAHLETPDRAPVAANASIRDRVRQQHQQAAAAAAAARARLAGRAG